MMGQEAGKKKSGNRWIWIIAGLVVLAGALVLGNRLISSRSQAQPQPETAKAFVGELSGSITGSGHLQPKQDVSLSMATNGIVKEVNIKVGDTVKAGDVLVRLDDADARQSVTKAELQVDSARLDVQSAQNTLDDRAHWAPNQKQVVAAQGELANAEASLEQAQSTYDKVSSMPGVSASQPSLNLEQATNSFNVAKANLDYLYSNRPDTRSAAINLESAKLALKQAEISLESAQTALDKTVLRAPFSATVMAVNVSEGEAASGVVVQMASMGSLEVVLDIDEIDIGSLEVGQSAVVSLTTWPDAQIAGEVLSIAPQANQNAGSDVINYEVRLSLNQTDLPVRAGMTANATITTFKLTNVLLVPNRAISVDREAGKYTVNLMTEQGVQKTEVTVGVHNETYTQILLGLQDGDELLIGDSTPLQNLGPGNRNNQGAGPGALFGGSRSQ